MENLNESRKLSEEALEKMNGGRWDPDAAFWFLRNQHEIMQRARDRGTLSTVLNMVGAIPQDEKTWYIDDLKKHLKDLIDISGLD